MIIIKYIIANLEHKNKNKKLAKYIVKPKPLTSLLTNNIINSLYLTFLKMVENFNLGQKRTPEDLSRLQKERILASAELVKEGAEVTPKGEIVNVDQEGDYVWTAKEEAREKLEEKERQKALTEEFEEEILTQKPGHWRTVAKTIDIGSGKIQTDTAPYEKLIEHITLIQGDTINVQREREDIIPIKVITPRTDLKPETTTWYYVPKKDLMGVKVVFQGPDEYN